MNPNDPTQSDQGGMTGSMPTDQGGAPAEDTNTPPAPTAPEPTAPAETPAPLGDQPTSDQGGQQPGGAPAAY